MVRFSVLVDVRAPAEYVADWWNDYREDDVRLDPAMEKRTVERLDERRVRLSTVVRQGGRSRQNDGVATRDGPLRWHYAGTVHHGGRPFGALGIAFEVEPTPRGSRLRADFSVEGKDAWRRLLLTVARGYLRRDRERVYAGYVPTIERDFASKRAG